MLFSLRVRAPTCRQIIELLSFKVQCFFISKKIRIIQSRFVHELERLGDQEDGENNKINFPTNAFILQAQYQF